MSSAPHGAARLPPSRWSPDRPISPARRVIKSVLGVYMRHYHHLTLLDFHNLPARGPLILVVNHASLLDVPAFMVADPYPNTSAVVKASLFKVPVLAWFLNQWNAIPVERQGRDSASLRAMLGGLRAGGIITLAAEGHRTRSGRLEPVNLVLARFVAGANVPVLPVGISGSFQALPPGAWFPRPRKITIRVGPVFQFPRGTDAATAAERIERELAALLPADMQPLPRQARHLASS